MKNLPFYDKLLTPPPSPIIVKNRSKEYKPQIRRGRQCYVALLPSL